jgi:uncharacterized protein (UPF0335 family)
MPKELKFDDAKIHDQDAPKKIPNSGDVKGFITKIHKVMEDMDTAKSDLKQLYSDAKDQGIDPKALKVVVKHKKSPVSVEHRQEVNELLEKTGDQPMFAFV